MLVNTRSLFVIFIAILLSLIPHDMMYGPQAALIAGSSTGRLRYIGASLGYQLASRHCGRPCTANGYYSAYAVAAYIFVCAVLTLIAMAMMKDYTGKDIEGEYQ
jgi:hypothetical protein